MKGESSGKQKLAMHVDEIRRVYKDKVYTTTLLRHTYRENGKIKQKTLANLSALPPDVIAVVKAMIKGAAFAPVGQAVEILRSLRHGDVACALATANRLGLADILDPSPSSMRDLALALIVKRVVDPRSKLATSRVWDTTTVPEDLGVQGVSEDDLYAAMDWLLERQDRIEAALARHHLAQGGLVLYDLTSTYVEGSHCPLARFGYSRDKKRGKRQIEYGLLTDARGVPVAVEVFAGNTADPKTVQSQVDKLRERFHLERVVLVGDRGMLTSARIDALRKEGGMDWISSLRAPQIRLLVEQGAIQLTLFDEKDLAEVRSPEFPGERLIVCKNPKLAGERARKRKELLAGTESHLAAVAQQVAQGRLRDEGKIGERVGRVIDRYKMQKHFGWKVTDGQLVYWRDEAAIEAEARLDGLYVIRTSVGSEKLTTEQAVVAYKSLSQVERAFRTLKSVDLRVRPVHHWSEGRVRAHVLLCMLAYYVEWHLREAWAPLLYTDEEPGQRTGASPVTAAVRSEAGREKVARGTTADGLGLHSFETLLADLATVTRNLTKIPAMPDVPAFWVTSTPSPVQRRALELAGAEMGGGRQKRPA